jgi:hypothetical protein
MAVKGEPRPRPGAQLERRDFAVSGLAPDRVRMLAEALGDIGDGQEGFVFAQHKTLRNTFTLRG